MSLLSLFLFSCSLKMCGTIADCLMDGVYGVPLRLDVLDRWTLTVNVEFGMGRPVIRIRTLKRIRPWCRSFLKYDGIQLPCRCSYGRPQPPPLLRLIMPERIYRIYCPRRSST